MPFSKSGPYIVVLLLLLSLPALGQYSQKDLLRESNVLFESGQYAQAMTGYAQLLSLDPANVEYSYKYGATVLYGDPSKRAEAIKYLRFASGKPGISPLSWYFLGRAYHLNYQFADAVGAYEKFAAQASKSELEQWQIAQVISSAQNGKNLLSQIKDVTVLDKKKSTEQEFFRLYDLSDIGGKILVTPQELLSNLDIKRNHKSLIHYRGTGTTIYFSSYGKDGKNGLDIYSAQVLPGGTYSDPRPLPGNINTPADEDFPYMHPDGKTFYFSSKGHSSMGGYDVFKSSVDQGSGLFSSPINMDFAINTPDDDIFYIADSLNRRANFASGRSSKQGELHVYQVVVDMKPVELTLVKGSFANSITPSQRTIKITVADAATNKQVEVQYSDPVTGDYLLTFPKSGKYKLAVEAQNSDRVHNGIVQIPDGDGVSAYLQEMELVAPSGMEKLIINNLFDKKYEGDLAALVQQMLRKRAELEVNFDAIVEDEVVVVQEQAAANVAMAYNEAGFGAGMSNEMVLANAKARKDELASATAEVAIRKNQAALEASAAFAEAEVLFAKAKILAAIDPDTDGGKAAFEAAVAQWEAINALQKASSAAELKSVLADKEAVLNEKLSLRKVEVNSLAEALSSDDYETALKELKAENERLKNYDRVAERVDMLAEVSLAGKEARLEADRYMSRATKMRGETEALIQSRNAKKRQLESQKGKAAAETEAEIARLNIDIADMEQATTKAYAQANAMDAEAISKLSQVALLQKFNADPALAPESEQTKSETISDAKLQKFYKEINLLPVDKSVAAAYAARHPEALASLGTANELRAFQKLTGVGADIMIDDAAFNDGSQQASKEGGSNVTSSTREKPSTASNATDSTIDSEEKLVADQKKETAKPESLPSEKPSTDVAITATQPTEADKLESADETAQDELANATEDIDAEIALLIASYKPAELEQQLQKEGEMRDAAQDWVVIIDESISNIVNGPDAQSADNKAQLDEYSRLRKEKEKEINRRERIIDALLVATATNTEAMRTAAIIEAQSDIQAMDAAYVSRLESKINEASSKPDFVADISTIDNAYIAQLTEAELSGKSAPEIASVRTELNARLIADIASQIKGDVPTVLTEERLLELRAIKALEMEEDKAIMEGRMAYAPRTAEAIAYREMLADDSKEVTGAPLEEQKQSVMLSPDLEQALKKPYSWDDVVPGYIDIMSETADVNTPKSALLTRIEAHGTMLVKIKEEIDIYSLLAAQEDYVADARVKQRYEQLLSERATIEEVLQEDQNLLAQALKKDEEIALSQKQSSSEQGLGKSETAGHQTISTVSAGTSNKAVETIVVEVNAFVEELDQTLDNKYLNTAAKDDPSAVKLRMLAQYNREASATINSKIDALLLDMDNASSDAERDAIQVQIQKLDGIQADKLQEADRLETEAESAEMLSFDNAAEITPSSTELLPQKGSIEVVGEMELEEIRIAKASPIIMEEFTYRSLQANINGSKLEKSASEAIEKRKEAARLIEQYQASNTQEERQEVYTSFQNVANQIKRADIDLNKTIKLANTSEVEYYTSNSEMLLYSALLLTVTPDERKELNILRSRIAEIEREVLLNHEVRDELDAFDTAAYSEMLKQERALILELEKVHANLETYSTNLQLQASSEDISPVEVSVEVAQIDPIIQDDTSAIAQTPTYQKLENPEQTKDNDTSVAALTEAVENQAVDEVPVASEEMVVQDKEAEHLVLPGKTYLTPALQRSASEISVEQKEQLLKAEPMLSPKLEFAQVKNNEEKTALLGASTSLDSERLTSLAKSPSQINYLTAAILADSLKKIEMKQSSLVATNYEAGRERMAEAERLSNMATYESNEARRQSILQRAERIESEGVVAYQKAALAAKGAEEIRSERIEQEANLASAALKLKEVERAELNKLLKTKAYTVVVSDLASSELSTSTPQVKPQDDIIQSLAETKTSTAAPPVVAAESMEATTSGNWLQMVEIIADKTDFSDVKETMFVFADKAMYAAEKPIPVDPEMPSGLIFQVQIGAFRKPIPQDLFGNIVPVMGQKLENGITRYRAGLFKEYRKAIEARDVIRGMGYSDAFVVVYVDGELLTAAQARDILAQARALTVSEDAQVQQQAAVKQETAQIQIPEVSKRESGVEPSSQQTATRPAQQAEQVKPIPAYYNDPEAAAAVQVEVVRGLFYTVQVGVYSKPVKLDQLYNLQDLNSELTAGGLIRYTTGRYSTLPDAGLGKQLAVASGVTDAFITAYYNGKRISLTEAATVLEREGPSILNINARSNEATPGRIQDNDEKNDVESEINEISPSSEPLGEVGNEEEGAHRYIIILGQFGNDVPQDIANFFLDRADMGIRRIEGPGGQSIYISPEFNTKAEANKFLTEAQAAGVDSAIMGTSKEGKIKALETK